MLPKIVKSHQHHLILHPLILKIHRNHSKSNSFPSNFIHFSYFSYGRFMVFAHFSTILSHKISRGRPLLRFSPSRGCQARSASRSCCRRGPCGARGAWPRSPGPAIGGFVVNQWDDNNSWGLIGSTRWDFTRFYLVFNYDQDFLPIV